MFRSGIALLIAAAIAGLGACAAETAGAEGKKLFNKRCGNCHKVGDVGQGLKGLTAEERTRHLDRFLAVHHAPDATERAAIIAYMNERLDR